MPIPYKERRRRRQKLVEELPPSLRGRVALRNVEAVAKFSSQTQETLAGALDAGVRISVAIPHLKDNPDAKVEEIVQVCRETADRPKPNAEKGSQTPPDTQDITNLADLLQTCYPDMPRATAEAMAGSELLSEVLGVVSAQRACFETRHAESDFVVIVLCGLALRTIERLNQIIPKRPIYRQALQQSGVEWPY